MRRAEQEITDRKEIIEILREAQVCRIAMIDDVSPYIVPVNFGFRDNTFYFHSATEGKKVDLLERNPAVCIEIDIPGPPEIPEDRKPCNFGMQYRSVIARGKAVRLDNPAEKREALAVIIRRFDPDNPCEFPEKTLSRTAVFSVTVDEMTAKHSS